jgi:hypothetical protein
MKCKICAGPVVKWGSLGDVNHGRCRDCGMDWGWKTRRRKANKKALALKVALLHVRETI